MSQPPYTGWVVHCLLSKPPPFEPADSHHPDPPPRRTTEPPLRRAGAIPVASAAAPPIDAGSSIRKSIKLVARYVLLSPVTNASWEARSEIFEEVGDASESESATSPESVLVPGSPSRSRASVFYSEISRGIHGRRSGWGSWWKMSTLSLGLYAAISRLLLDQHCSIDNSNTRPLLLVAASLGRMFLMRPIRIDTDLQIVRAVTWVGRSSMEIHLEVTQSTEGREHTFPPAATKQLQESRYS